MVVHKPTLNWHLCASQAWMKPFHSSKNCCLPGALLSQRSSQTWSSTVLCSCSHRHWIPVGIRTAETCTSPNKTKTDLSHFYLSSNDETCLISNKTHSDFGSLGCHFQIMHLYLSFTVNVAGPACSIIYYLLVILDTCSNPVALNVSSAKDTPES